MVAYGDAVVRNWTGHVELAGSVCGRSVVTRKVVLIHVVNGKSKRSIAVRNTPHRYENSRARWDHTVLLAAQQRWHSRLYTQPKLVLD